MASELRDAAHRSAAGNPGRLLDCRPLPGVEKVLFGPDSNADDLASPGEAGEGERQFQEKLKHTVDRARLDGAGEGRPAAVTEAEAEAPEVVARLGAVPAPCDAAPCLFDRAGQRLWREVGKVPRQLET